MHFPFHSFLDKFLSQNNQLGPNINRFFYHKKMQTSAKKTKTHTISTTKSLWSQWTLFHVYTIKANFLDCVVWGQMCIQEILTPYIVKDGCSTCLPHILSSRLAYVCTERSTVQKEFCFLQQRDEPVHSINCSQMQDYIKYVIMI